MAQPNQFKLIINYLPQAMTDTEFSNLFATCGVLSEAKIMRDRNTGYSYGYGFIEYTNQDDCERAIQKLNGHKIAHKTLKVAYSKPAASKNVNLHVTGLGTNATEESIKELFSSYTQVIQVRILREKETGESRGAGFVLCNSKEEADSAMHKLQGYADGYGMNLQIKYAEDSNSQRVNHPAFQAYLQKQAQLQYGGFGAGAAYGGVTEAGYGGVNPQAPYNQFAAHSYDQSGGMQFGDSYNNAAIGGADRIGRGRGARFNPLARPGNTPADMMMGNMGAGAPGATGGDNVLFVYNIGSDATEAEMYKLFCRHGRISKIDIVGDKGYAFVHMPVPGEAHAAMSLLNGIPYKNGKELQVKFKK